MLRQWLLLALNLRYVCAARGEFVSQGIALRTGDTQLAAPIMVKSNGNKNVADYYKKGNILKEGWLKKKYKDTQEWRRRWVVLTPHYLATFKEQGDYQNPTEVIRLREVLTVQSVSSSETGKSTSFSVKTKQRALYLAADNTAEQTSWVGRIDKQRKRQLHRAERAKVRRHHQLPGGLVKENIIKEGHLEKKSRHANKWRWRWSVLTPQYLATFREERVYQNPTEVIHLQEVTAVEKVSPYVFQKRNTFAVNTGKEDFTLATDANDAGAERQGWIDRIKLAWKSSLKK